MFQNKPLHRHAPMSSRQSEGCAAGFPLISRLLEAPLRQLDPFPRLMQGIPERQKKAAGCKIPSGGRNLAFSLPRPGVYQLQFSAEALEHTGGNGFARRTKYRAAHGTLRRYARRLSALPFTLTRPLRLQGRADDDRLKQASAQGRKIGKPKASAAQAPMERMVVR